MSLGGGTGRQGPGGKGHESKPGGSGWTIARFFFFSTTSYSPTDVRAANQFAETMSLCTSAPWWAQSWAPGQYTVFKGAADNAF